MLRYIAEGGAVVNMARTSRELKINRTTLLRLLHTLETERFIEYLGERQGWRIGLGLISLTAHAFFSDDLVQLGMPVAARLAELLGLSSHLGVLDGLEVVYVVRRTPNHAFASNIRLGSRLPAHATVMGRIILAHLPPGKVAAMYRGIKLKAATSHTPLTLADLQAELTQDRRAGIAWSDGFFEPTIAPRHAQFSMRAEDRWRQSMSSVRRSAFTGGERRALIARELARGADEISRRLGWVEPSTAAAV